MVLRAVERQVTILDKSVIRRKRRAFWRNIKPLGYQKTGMNGAVTRHFATYE